MSISRRGRQVVVPGLLGLLLLAAPSSCRVEDRSTGDPTALQAVELEATRTARWRGGESVHEAQLRGGVSVRGAGIVRHRRPGRAEWVVSRLQPELTVDPRPRLTPAEAAVLLAATLPGAAGRALDPQLVIVPTARGGELRYEAVVSTADPLATWRLAVDAHDGTPRRPVRLGARARGNAYPVNPAHGPPESVELLDLAGDESHLIGSRADVTSDDLETRFATADGTGDFLYEPDATSFTDAFAEVNAYYHLTRIAASLEAAHGFTLGEPLLAIVNYAPPGEDEFDNAEAFELDDGRPVVRMGQAAGHDWAYDGPTLAHELGHHLFDQRNGISEANDYPIHSDALGFHPAPQALNEAASDYWGATLYDEPEVALSEGAMSYNPRALDSALRCPDDVWGEAHLDAPIVSGALWDIREAVGAELADEMVFAMLGAVSDSPTFAEIAAILTDEAEALEEAGDLEPADVAAVSDALDAHGLPACDRSVAVADGVPLRTHLAGAEAAALLAEFEGDLCATLREGGVRVPLPFQLALADPGEPVEALDVHIDMARQDGVPVAEGDLSYAVLIRRSEPITFDLTALPLGENELSLPTEAVGVDHIYEGSPSRLEISASELGVGEGAGSGEGGGYYVDLLALNCFSVAVEVTLSWIRAASEETGDMEPDTGADAEDAPEADGGPSTPGPGREDDGGCQVASSGALGAELLAMLLLLGLGKLRRNRDPSSGPGSRKR